MSTPATGEFLALIASLVINISAERPAVMTRLEIRRPGATTNDIITHTVRLNNADSLRIGFDELRSAFPNELSALNDEDLLTTLIEKTDDFVGKQVQVGIETQVKNGIVQKAANGTPYYNVRLRSAVKNMPKEQASSLAKRMLQSVASKAAVDHAFDDASS